MAAKLDYSSEGEIDIVVQLDELLDEQNRHRVERYLLKMTGIVRVQFDKFRQHLVIISYDPAESDSLTILRYFKRQRLTAQLVVGI